MNKEKFLNELKGIDREAWGKIKWMAYMAGRDPFYARSINWREKQFNATKMYQVVLNLFWWGGTLEGDIYWGKVYDHLAELNK